MGCTKATQGISKFCAARKTMINPMTMRIRHPIICPFIIDTVPKFLGENERINEKIGKDNLYSSSLGPLSQPPNTKRDIT